MRSARSTLVPCIFVVLFSGCNASRAAEPASAPKPSGAAAGPTQAAPSLAYTEITTGTARRDDALPLIVALHGLGDTPESFVRVFDGFPTNARVVVPHSATRYSDGWAWFPPRGEPGSNASAEDIARMADAVATFIGQIARLRPTLGKPIVTGFSQGGALSFAIAVRHAESIGAALPVGGWLPSALYPEQRPANAAPIFAFHGVADPRVPLPVTRTGAARLTALGFAVDLREFDGVGHGIPPVVEHALWNTLSRECEEQAGATK